MKRLLNQGAAFLELVGALFKGSPLFDIVIYVQVGTKEVVASGQYPQLA